MRLTLPLCFRWLPAVGLCEITRPAFTLLEKACLTFPAEQECALSARSAAESLCPLTCAPPQFLSATSAAPFRPPVTLILHLDSPPHPTAPDQPAKAEPLEAFAFRVTV